MAPIGGARLPRLFLAALLAAAPAPGSAAPDPGEACRLLLVGDSTMSSRTGYGDALCALFGRDVECVNLARGGRSTRSYREDGSWERVRARLADREAACGTVVVVQFGHNDQPGKPGRSTDLEREYPANLGRYVDEIREAGAWPVLVTPLSRRKFRGAALEDDLKPWAEATTRVAAGKRVPLVNLHADSVAALERMGPEEADTLAMPPPDFDRTHLGAKGGALFAAMVARDLVGVVPGLASRLLARPQLTDDEARQHAMRQVLGRKGSVEREIDDPWDPAADPFAKGERSTPDYVVDANAAPDGRTTFDSLQDAVDAAVGRAETERSGRRLHIRVRPGTYAGPIYVPESAAPLSIAGEGVVRIAANLDAQMTGARFSAAFGARYAGSGPRVAAMAALLKGRDRIGTSGTAVLWIRGDGFQLSGIEVENAYNRGRADGPSAMQAVAVFVDGADRAHFESVRLLGLQDTLYLRAPAPGRISRSYFNESLVEGDVDFVFGDGTAYFRRTEIRTSGPRETRYALAPAHHVQARHGFVFDECRFTFDGPARTADGRSHLARQWFRGQRCTPYGPGPSIPGYACRLGDTDAFDGTVGTVSRDSLQAVGKVAILRSRIGSSVDRARPWADWNAPGTPRYRPVQYHASAYRANLGAAGIDAARDLGHGARDLPDTPFLAEYRNVQD